MMLQRKRKSIPKKVRQAVYDKYGGRCAYCGEPLQYKDMQVDHLVSVMYRNGSDDMSNLMPSCRLCNFYKGTDTVEQFRANLAEIPRRLAEHKQHRVIYNLAKKHGMVVETGSNIEFFFEAYGKASSSARGEDSV